MLIDIHTHSISATGKKSIQNLYKDFQSIEIGRFYSIGIHPWYFDEDFESQIENLISYANHVSVLAIGETGLDKICKTDFKLQQQIFSRQIQLANELRMPLIIHCVKAWAEVFSLLENGKVKVPVIFHGFNKSKSLAHEIVEQGYYLSFGKALEKESIKEVVREIAMNRFFLETDDADLKIEEIYMLAANALSIDLNSLSLQIQKNAIDVLGTSFLI